jgi:GntR family transcriptional regulator, rspAB operon transcriptional repressor
MAPTLSASREEATFAVDSGGRSSKVDRIYFALKRTIVSGALAPDTPIDKGEWSARFEVSRLSVTTAINRLAYERLVIIEPQRGTFVTKMRLADVKQWMLVRRALETEVIAICARDLSDEAIERFGRNLAYQRTALDNGDVQGFHELDTLFHRQMADGLGFARVSEVLDPVRTHLDRVRRMLLPEPGRMESTFAEHQAIHNAVATRQPEAARRAMGDHLESVLRELESFATRHPGFFES